MAFPEYTDLYIDVSATGTGSGDTPANACIKVLNNSLFTSNGSLHYRAWVRRTHIESVVAGDLLGASFFTDNTRSDRHWIIGWPSSGDPMYEARPAAGVTAGWDTDINTFGVASVYGLNFPVLTASANNALDIKAGHRVMNFCFNMQNSGSMGEPGGLSVARQGTYLDNIVFTNRAGPTNGLNFTSGKMSGRIGRLWLIHTPSPNPPIRTNSGYLDELVIHSLSMITSGALVNESGGNYFIGGQVINYSNSVDYIFGSQNKDPSGLGSALISYVRRVTGIIPYSGFLGFVGPQQNGTFNILHRCDDWFGQGPFMSCGVFGPHIYMATSAQARYSNNRVMIADCSSWGGGFPVYGLENDLLRPVSKLFDVTSGSTVTIHQPVYVSSTGVFSLSNGTALSYLRALGCQGQHVTSAHLATGTLSNWAGSKLGGGAAWTIVTTFTPQETGQVLYECTLPIIIQSAQIGVDAYALYGEPWVV